MARPNRRKSNSKKTDHTQRMNRLKAKALTKVAGHAWGYEQRYRSIKLLEEAVRRDPKNPEILLKLAAALGKQRNYDKAEELLSHVLELAPRKASLHRRVAQTYAEIDRPERAVECYRRSLELNSDTSVTVPTLLELAAHYERRHQIDDASAAVNEALTREPNNEHAQLQQAILNRRLRKSDQAESALRALVADHSRTWGTRAQAWYELAQLLDDRQQYEDAYQALLSAKGIVAPYAAECRANIQQVMERNAEFIASLDRDCYESWQKGAEGDKPYRIAALTGHPRSGTTLIEQVLDSHDQVISADEFDVFARWVSMPIIRKFPPTMPLRTVLEHVPQKVLQMARAKYWEQTEAIFAEPIGERMLIDKNPGMMIMLPVVNWAFPEMKMLIALRDPRDVVLSCFMQKVPLTPISSQWLALPDAAEYYACVMRTWLKVRELTSGTWLEFRYEDVVADLEREARRIFDFLGLPWDDKVLKFYDHARDKLVRSPTYRDVTQPVYQKSLGRWQNYAQHFEPILETLQPLIKEFGYE